MDQARQSQYRTILGQNPENRDSKSSLVIVSHVLPKIGEHGFTWVVAEAIGKEYGHYGFKLHPKANPVNVHVYGDCNLIQRLARTGKAVKCELELVVKTTATGREFVFVNLYLTKPHLRETHRFSVVSAPQNHPDSVFTTKDMRGVGVKVEKL